MSSVALIKPTIELLSTSSALFLSGYHYASDRVALPNTLDAKSISPEDAVRAWFRAWDVGRVVGPLCVNVSMIGFAILAFLEGRQSPNFAIYSIASGAQVSNVIYTVFGVFKLNDKLLAEHERVKTRKETSDPKKLKTWVEEWKAMDRKRMLMMNLTAALGLITLWRR